jgi:hypothetical protein
MPGAYTGDRRDQGRRTHYRMGDPGIEIQFGSTEHREWSTTSYCLNSCHREISGERRSALAALLGTLPEQKPSKMRQVMRNVTLCLIATWIAISALTSSAQAATFGSSAWWQQMDSDGRGGRGG